MADHKNKYRIYLRLSLIELFYGVESLIVYFKIKQINIFSISNQFLKLRHFNMPKI